MAASISRMSAHPGNKGPQWSSFPSDWRCCNSDFHPDFFLFFSFFLKTTPADPRVHMPAQTTGSVLSADSQLWAGRAAAQ